ncbi:MAG: hypothetical protein FJW37_14655 [Acidobacteria bacterium]|nr:hypothetical protein [Acidobacteriota bacterium]
MEIPVHPFVVGDRTQCASENQPVKAGQRTRDLVLVLGDKLVHGVSALLGWMVVENQYPTRSETPSPFGCGYAAL